MTQKTNAREIIERNRLREQKATVAKREEETRKANARKNHLLHKLLRGERLNGEEGRQIFWDLIANSPVLQVDPMTGNSQTYYILGMQAWPKSILKKAENIDFALVQKAGLEAHIRKQKEETD